MDRPLAVPINYHIQLSEVPLPPVSWGQGARGKKASPRKRKTVLL